MLKDAKKKIKQAGNASIFELEPEELQALQDEKPAEAGGPPPGYFDGMRNQEEYVPAEPVEYDPTPPADAPLTPEEEKYAYHPRLEPNT